MSGDFYGSLFYRWISGRKPPGFDERAERQQALALLVESVSAGEITTLDGVDSPLSKRIQARYQVAAFEMNSNWIGTSQDWVCPCCARSKFQIARVGKNRQILAKLVVHHDHMGDALTRSFHEEFERAGTTVEQRRGALLVERIGSAFAAYEEVLICEDCNNADGEGKKLVNYPPFFSFSLSQIRRFIRPAEHRRHEIDAALCEQGWQEAKPAYELRMKIIRAVARAAATDAHWYEPYSLDDRRANAIPMFGSRQNPDDRQIREWVASDELFDALGRARSPSAPNRTRWRTERAAPRGRPLPENYLPMLRTESAYAHAWDSVPDDWTCPICRRSRYQATYVAEDGKVVFYLRTNAGKGAWVEARSICNQCGDNLIQLKLEVSDLIGRKLEDTYALVTPEELARVIVARPHSSHEIRQELARQLVDACRQRLMSEP